MSVLSGRISIPSPSNQDKEKYGIEMGMDGMGYLYLNIIISIIDSIIIIILLQVTYI